MTLSENFNGSGVRSRVASSPKTNDEKDSPTKYGRGNAVIRIQQQNANRSVEFHSWVHLSTKSVDRTASDRQIFFHDAGQNVFEDFSGDLIIRLIRMVHSP
jgi:hypothetical protein